MCLTALLHPTHSSSRFPQEFVSSQVVLTPGDKSCEEGSCEASGAVPDPQGAGKIVTVPKALRQKQLVKVLEKFK